MIPMNMNLPEEDYTSVTPAQPTNAAMSKLTSTVEEYEKVCTFLAKYEDLVERGKKRKQQLEEDEIPQILEVECGMQMCCLPSGLRVEVKTDYYANIPAQSTIEKMKDREEAARLQERHDKAMEWIDQNAPHVAKRKFEVMFNRDEQKLADKFERDLKQRKRPVNVVRGTTVHPQTLNALVRQLIDQNIQVPRDILGVHEKKVAKIKRPDRT